MSKIKTIYTDGGVVRKNPSPYGGTWAWIALDENDEVIDSDYGLVQGTNVTNNQMEQLAIIEALEKVPEGWSGKICSDSQVALGRLLDDWALRNLGANLVGRLRRVQRRIGKVEGELLKGHPTKADFERGMCKKGRRVSKWNVWCDEKCSEAGDNYAKTLGV